MARWADLSTIPTEATYTKPHELAPHPEHWHAPDSDSTECEVSELVGALVRALQPDLVVETGTAFGYTAVEIGRALKANGHGRLVTLEIDPARVKAARKLLAQNRLSGIVELREQSSLEYMPDEPIGFAWFDSLYELRAREFLAYRELGTLRPGTVCGFHDALSGLRRHYMDITAEVRKLEQKRLLKAITIPTPRGVMLAQVL